MPMSSFLGLRKFWKETADSYLVHRGIIVVKETFTLMPTNTTGCDSHKVQCFLKQDNDAKERHPGDCKKGWSISAAEIWKSKQTKLVCETKKGASWHFNVFPFVAKVGCNGTGHLRCTWPPWLSKKPTDVSGSGDCDSGEIRFNFPHEMRDKPITFRTPRYSTCPAMKTTTVSARPTESPTTTGAETSEEQSPSMSRIPSVSTEKGTTMTNKRDEKKDGGEEENRTLIIVVSVLGAAFGIAIIVIPAIFIIKWKKDKKEKEEKKEKDMRKIFDEERKRTKLEVDVDHLKAQFKEVKGEPRSLSTKGDRTMSFEANEEMEAWVSFRQKHNMKPLPWQMKLDKQMRSRSEDEKPKRSLWKLFRREHKEP